MARVNSGGVEIAYDVLNANGPGVPVFFIAGLNGMRGSCMKQALPFSRERPVVVHDHRGTGESGKPLGVYSVQNMAKDVVAIMDAPDGTAVAAVSIAIGAGGAIQNARTTKLLSGAEYVNALKKASSIAYKPAK